ncbi:hypothetical protein DXT88_17880 [Herbaspirillum lusitanum]|nr:hypothetical protein [Herbaspirillum lusitanum]
MVPEKNFPCGNDMSIPIAVNVIRTQYLIGTMPAALGHHQMGRMDFSTIRLFDDNSLLIMRF